MHVETARAFVIYLQIISLYPSLTLSLYFSLYRGSSKYSMYRRGRTQNI